MGFLLIFPVMLTHWRSDWRRAFTSRCEPMANKVTRPATRWSRTIATDRPSGNIQSLNLHVTTTSNPVDETLPAGQKNPYAAPAVGAMPVATSPQMRKAIREPSFGNAIGIVLLAINCHNGGEFCDRTSPYPAKADRGDPCICVRDSLSPPASIPECCRLPTAKRVWFMCLYVLISIVVVLGILAVVVGISAIFSAGF